MTTFTRRLQRIGSSILVSLPKQWVDAHGLDKSAQVQIETTQNSLSITVDQGRKQSKEIEIPYPLSNEENLAANITGAYLLGYDIITIKGKSTISVKDREVIRESIRRLVGMEIMDEDASNINGQFLLDETSLNPEKIIEKDELNCAWHVQRNSTSSWQLATKQTFKPFQTVMMKLTGNIFSLCASLGAQWWIEDLQEFLIWKT